MADNPILLVPLILIIFFAGFAALWLTITFLTSRLGWHAIAQRYEGTFTEQEINERLSWRSGRVGRSRYSGVLTFTFSDQDLGLSVLALYRLGHPPLKIPYEEITAVEKTVIIPEVHLSFAQVPDRSIKISRRLANQIAEASNGKLGLTSEQ